MKSENFRPDDGEVFDIYLKYDSCIVFQSAQNVLTAF